MTNSDELFRACGTLLQALDWIGKAAVPSLEKMESEFRQQPSLVAAAGSAHSSACKLKQLGIDLTNRWVELKMLAEICYAEEQQVKACKHCGQLLLSQQGAADAVPTT